MPTPAPRQIRTRRFPPSGSSVDVTRGDSRPTTFRSLGDMSSNVKALGMVPFRSSHQHGPPWLGRVQGLSCSLTSSLVCSPPTPCPLQPPLWFPLRVAYLAAGASSVPLRPTTRALANVSCVGDGSPALRKTGMRRGEARASQVTGPSSSCVPWSNTPPDTFLSSPT